MSGRGWALFWWGRLARRHEIGSAPRMGGAMLERLNSLWIGRELGHIERLTVVSALSVGHPFTIYSYAPEKLSGAPSGAEVRDAREVAPYETLADHIEVGRGALASDFFRYALLAKGLGYWVDLDLVFLKAIDFDDEYVFGWENKNSINGAVLRLPRDSDMLRELCRIPQINWRPPFYGPRKAALYYWDRLTKRDVRPQDYRWGTFGPSILTYLARKYGVAGRAKARSVFYPAMHFQVELFLRAPELIESLLTADTRTVHLWQSVLRRKTSVVPPGSYLESALRRHGISAG
jgi:hypothetical protein